MKKTFLLLTALFLITPLQSALSLPVLWGAINIAGGGYFIKHQQKTPLDSKDFGVNCFIAISSGIAGLSSPDNPWLKALAYTYLSIGTISFIIGLDEQKKQGHVADIEKTLATVNSTLITGRVETLAKMHELFDERSKITEGALKLLLGRLSTLEQSAGSQSAQTLEATLFNLHQAMENLEERHTETHALSATFSTALEESHDTLMRFMQKEFRIHREEMSGNCVICSHSFPVQELTCGHIFHGPCIDTWFARQGNGNHTCPVCREKEGAAEEEEEEEEEEEREED